MQNIIRTIDTAEAFRIKIKLLQDELAEKKSELRKLEDVGVFTSAGGGLVKFFGAIAYVLCALTVFVLITTSQSSFNTAEENVLIGFLAVLFFITGFLIRRKGKKLVKDAEDKRIVAEGKKQKLLVEIEKLETEIKRQESIIQDHMLNQHELLDLEIKAISQLSHHQGTQLDFDTKECPMCAEAVKAKAKICRFCNYKFAD